MNNQRTVNGFIMLLPNGQYIYAGYRKSFAPGGTSVYASVVADLTQASFFPNAAMNSVEVDEIRKTYPTAFMVSARQVVTLELTGPVNVGKGGD